MSFPVYLKKYTFLGGGLGGYFGVDCLVGQFSVTFLLHFKKAKQFWSISKKKIFLAFFFPFWFGIGELWFYCRASMSIAGVFPP